jgi:DNA-binding transcriptional LysR family regulator
MLDVHRLRLLREVDRLGTLAAVARALSYSPSAISQQLSQLESETGVRLLEPAGRGVRLTAQARILVAHTERILQELEAAEAELRGSLTEVTGTLRVASFQSVLLALVPAALTLLARRHPGLRVEIAHQDAGPAYEGVLAHEFDIVLGEEYPGLPQAPVPGVDAQLLARDELLLAVPAHGRYARGGPDPSAPVPLTELADVPWVLGPLETIPTQWAQIACRNAGFEPDVRFASPDLLLQVHLVETGHAAAILPGLLLTDRSPAVRLSRLPGRPHRKLTTGVRAGATRHPAIRAFRDALRRAFRESGETGTGHHDQEH